MLKLKFLFPRLLLLTGLVGSAVAQVDDFSCPDEFEGFYPHLYRSVYLPLSHHGVNRVTQLKDREASVVWSVVCGVVWCGVVWCGVVWCGLCWLRYLTLNKWIISTGILHWNEVACPGLVSALFLAVFPLILWSTSGGYVPGLTSTSFHSQNYSNSISICGEEYTGVQSTGQSSHIFKNPNQIKFPALLPINVVAAAALGRLQG